MTPQDRADLAELLPYAAAYLRELASKGPYIATGLIDLLHKHADTADRLREKVGTL